MIYFLPLIFVVVVLVIIKSNEETVPALSSESLASDLNKQKFIFSETGECLNTLWIKGIKTDKSISTGTFYVKCYVAGDAWYTLRSGFENRTEAQKWIESIIETEW